MFVFMKNNEIGAEKFGGFNYFYNTHTHLPPTL
jgi:hypothetical protein